MLIDEFDMGSSAAASATGHIGGQTGVRPNREFAAFGRHAREQVRVQQRLSASTTTFTLPSPKSKLKKNPAVQKRQNLMSKFLARSLDLPKSAERGMAATAGLSFSWEAEEDRPVA